MARHGQMTFCPVLGSMSTTQMLRVERTCLLEVALIGALPLLWLLATLFSSHVPLLYLVTLGWGLSTRQVVLEFKEAPFGRSPALRVVS
eukprot:3571449-Amphidinium_carterae.1